jgi:predicted nucleic acid-binding Zn ribbon protein
MNRFSRFETVGSILDEVLADSGYLAVAREGALLEQWPRLAGVQIAAVAKAERVEDGVMYVRVSSASWRQELAYLKQTLLDKIQKECSTIRDIVFY